MKYLLASLCVVLSATLAPAHALDGAVLATFGNGDAVTEKDLEDYLSRRTDLRPVARNAWGVEQVVTEMVMTRALMLEGERLAIPRRQSNESGDARFDDVYGSAVFNKKMPVCEKPEGDEQARKYFDGHPEAFLLPGQARVQRIILPFGVELQGQSASHWLQAQVPLLASGEKQFSDLVKPAEAVHSLDPQGDLGWLTLEGDAAVMRALQGVQAGELLGPVRDGDFVYLFRVEARREPRPLTWDEAKSFAATRAVNFCRSEASDRIRSELFERYAVQVDRAAIRRLFSKKDESAT